MATFSQKEMDQLRTQMYSGFVTKSVPRYEMRGAGSGRARRQTGYSQVTNYDAYNDGLLGRARDAAGIKNVNKDDEIRRIYDYIAGYKPPAAAALSPDSIVSLCSNPGSGKRHLISNHPAETWRFLDEISFADEFLRFLPILVITPFSIKISTCCSLNELDFDTMVAFLSSKFMR